MKIISWWESLAAFDWYSFYIPLSVYATDNQLPEEFGSTPRPRWHGYVSIATKYVVSSTFNYIKSRIIAWVKNLRLTKPFNTIHIFNTITLDEWELNRFRNGTIRMVIVWSCESCVISILSKLYCRFLVDFPFNRNAMLQTRRVPYK